MVDPSGAILIESSFLVLAPINTGLVVVVLLLQQQQQ
jgi:hypothetical protein